MRKAQDGDISPELSIGGLFDFETSERIEASSNATVAAIRDIVASASNEDVAVVAAWLRAVLNGLASDELGATRSGSSAQDVPVFGEVPIDPDDELVADCQSVPCPYANLMRRKTHEEQKFLLQVELAKLQPWVKDTGQRVAILFEGSDVAGKGGAIQRSLEHLNPPGARVVPLEKPTEQGEGRGFESHNAH